MILMCSPGINELWETCSICYMVLKESDEYKGMKEQLQAYPKKTQELGKGRRLGPPSLFAFGGLLLAL